MSRLFLRIGQICNILKLEIQRHSFLFTLPNMLSFSRRNLRLRAANARNINSPNAKNAITPTVIDDIVATKIFFVFLFKQTLKIFLRHIIELVKVNVEFTIQSTYFQCWDP